MEKDKQPKDSNIYVQMGIFAAILFVSQLISDLFPKSFVVPTPLIGMVLLYILLATHIVKLHQVAKFGDFMIGLIAFLFVPSGIQLAAHLDIMKKEGLQDVIVIIIRNLFIPAYRLFVPMRHIMWAIISSWKFCISSRMITGVQNEKNMFCLPS